MIKVVTPDFYPDFRCVGGGCTDNCCRQGWLIPVDREHLQQYKAMDGPLGQRVQAALEEADGETVLAMTGGVCRLLDSDGLCALAREKGEDALCRLCHTHPRFIEEYGGTREIHFSLQCPEAARLALEREAPITFRTAWADGAVTGPCQIDPDEYLALLEIRKFAVSLAQDRTLPVNCRFALLLQLARLSQKYLDRRKYALCKVLCGKFQNPVFRQRQQKRLARTGRRARSPFSEFALLKSLEHLTEEFPQILQAKASPVSDSREFDAAHRLRMEHLAVLYLSHYIPKAVNDGRADTKIRLAVFLCLTVRQLCLCTRRTQPEDFLHFAGLLAKEIEHSSENMAALYAALEDPCLQKQLAARLNLKKGDSYAI